MRLGVPTASCSNGDEERGTFLVADALQQQGVVGHRIRVPGRNRARGQTGQARSGTASVEEEHAMGETGFQPLREI
jgi:hypothetical protein